MEFLVQNVKTQIPSNITIVAATKYFTPDEMRDLYNEGIHHFGENRDNIIVEKQQALSDLPISWHFIGTLQTKKVKKVINSIEYLHSLDNFKLAEEINKRRTSPLKCFIQVNISSEDSKHGLSPKDVIPFIQSCEDLPNVNIIGLMGMAAFTDDQDLIHSQFQILNDLQQQIQTDYNITIPELSIGMSNDYHIAIEHNATFLRLGSVLFRREV